MTDHCLSKALLHKLVSK